MKTRVRLDLIANHMRKWLSPIIGAQTQTAISSSLRVVLIAALISFTSRADAACLTTGTMPSEQHASNCAEMGSGSDHAPKPVRGKTGTPLCAFACVALADTADAPLPSSQFVAVYADAMTSEVMAGASKRPPTPPPRQLRHRNINSI